LGLEVFEGGVDVVLDPGGFATGHFEPGDVGVEFADVAGALGGQDRFGDDGFDHEMGDGFEFGGAEDVDGVVAGDEGLEEGDIDFGGPEGGVGAFFKEGAELDGGVGDVDGADLDAGGVEIDDADDELIDKEDVGGVPIGMGDLRGPAGEAQAIGLLAGFIVGDAECAEGSAEFIQIGDGNAVITPLLDDLEAGFQDALDVGVVVDAARWRLEGGLVAFEEFVIEGEYAAGIVGGSGRAIVGSCGEIFEDFVDGAVELEDGVVAGAGALEVREGELAVAEVDLEFVGEGDFEGFIAAGGAAFEEEFSTVGFDDGFGRIGGAGAEFFDGGNVAEVVGVEDGFDFPGEEAGGL